MSTQPVLSQISPAKGPSAGGQTVTLFGVGFDRVSAVRFGGREAATFTVASPVQIVATTPPLSAGPVEVSVVTAEGLASLPGAYRAEPAEDLTGEPTPEEAEQILKELAESVSQELGEAIPAMSGVSMGLPHPEDTLTGELYRTLLEQIPAVTFITSFEQGLQKIYVSPQIESVLGYTPEEWLANPSLWYERLHPEDKDRWNVEFSQTVMTRGTGVRSVYRFLHRDGRVVWILGDVRIRRDEESGFPLFVQAVGFDITDLKRAEEALREIASTIRETFWVLSPELDRILYASPAFQAIWGVASTGLKGAVSEAILALVDPRDREAVAGAFAKLRQEETELEHRVRRPEGTTRWVRSRTFPVRGAGGVLEKIIAVSEDVTQRKELELQLRELDEREKVQLRAEVRKESGPDQFLGASEAVEAVRERVRRFAPRTNTVLIRGESGTGKELVARALHYSGPRAQKPFREVNSAGGIPHELVYSELFGHEKGAFTGADKRRIGKYEQADGGTLFLDEIGDMPLQTQTMLLKVLEQGCFERLGGTETIRADVRVLCATNRNLEDMIREGKFREDLYYRIRGLEILIPPLRERRSDIPELARHFLARANRDQKREVDFSVDALALLQLHPWPGNVRELKAAVEEAAVLCEAREILVKDLPPAIRLQASLAGTGGSKDKEKEKRLVEIVDDFERSIIVDALERAGWVKSVAARLLGINVKLLDYRIEKYGLEKS